jgi:hypothetical protein
MIYGKLRVKYNPRREHATLQEVQSMTYGKTNLKEQNILHWRKHGARHVARKEAKGGTP